MSLDHESEKGYALQTLAGITQLVECQLPKLAKPPETTRKSAGLFGSPTPTAAHGSPRFAARCGDIGGDFSAIEPAINRRSDADSNPEGGS